MTLSNKVRPLKVAHVLGPLTFGGIQAMALNIIKQLEGPAFSHVVISQDEQVGPWYPDFARHSRVRLCPAAKRRLFRFVLTLYGVLRDEKPDVVMSYLFGNHALVSWLARLAGVPRVYATAMNQPVDYAGSRWHPLLLAQLARPACTGEIAVSESVGAALIEKLLLPRRRVQVIENGCDIDAFANRAAAARAMRTPGGPTKLLMVGALGWRFKDPRTLVDAVERLIQRGHNIVLLLAGDGKARQGLETRLMHWGSPARSGSSARGEIFQS